MAETVDPNKQKLDESMAIDRMQPTYGLSKDQFAEVYDGQVIDGVTLTVFENKVTGASGGGGNLPVGLDALGFLPFSVPSVAVGESIDIGTPDVYTVLNGVLSGLNPAGVTTTFSAVPAGGAPGFDGEVTFDNGGVNPMTGVIEGTALVGVGVSVGAAPDADYMQLQRYYAVQVTAAA